MMINTFSSNHEFDSRDLGYLGSLGFGGMSMWVGEHWYPLVICKEYLWESESISYQENSESVQN